MACASPEKKHEAANDLAIPNVIYDQIERPRISDETTILSMGKELIEQNDCQSCHSVEDHLIGPSYRAVNRKYNGDTSRYQYLAEKIINGGGGVWGSSKMLAHQDISRQEAMAMVKYIMSLE